MKFGKQNYQFKLADGNFEIKDSSGEVLLLKNHGIPMLPLTSRGVVWGEPEVTFENNIITYKMADNWLWEQPKVIVECKEDYLEFYFKGRIKSKVALNKWYLFERGTTINAIECLDFRSRVETSDPYQTHQTVLSRRKLGQSVFQAGTEDSDYMFGPHPMMFVFQHLEHNLTIAQMGLINGESLQVSMEPGTTHIRDFYVRIGDNLYWLEPGEEVESPHFMIMPNKDKDAYETLAEYSNHLVRDGYTQAKKEADIEPWWLAPMWCSWGDQHAEMGGEGVIKMASDPHQRGLLLDRIHDNLVDHVVQIIEENELPIRTLILDDKWYDCKGDMYADKTKFPDMRATVDKLHAKGFKVIAWSSLYHFLEESKVYQEHPEWFLIHHYPRGWSKNDTALDYIHIDYSKPEIANAYLDDVLNRLLSEYDFDGIKFDWPFIIPHDYPYEDRNWIGKEMTVYNTQKLMYNKAKEIKSDALIIGVSPHPFFNDTQDIIRTYDINTFDQRIHINRARYVKAVSPGMIPAMDEHVHYQNFFRYLREGIDLGGIPMFYNLLCFQGDEYFPNQKDYAQMKSILDEYIEKTPILKDYLKKHKIEDISKFVRKETMNNVA